MIRFGSKILRGVLLASIFAASSAFAVGNDYANSGVGKSLDFFKTGNELVSDTAENLSIALSKAKNDDVLDALVKAVEKAGIDGGWAQQIGKLKSIAKSAGSVAKVLGLAITALEVKDIYDELVRLRAGGEQNKETFKKLVADAITEKSAEIIGGVVQGTVTTTGTALVAPSAPSVVGFVILEGCVLVTGWVSGEATEWAWSKLLHQEAIRNLLLDLGEFIWDHAGVDGKTDGGVGPGGNGQVCKPGDDPFDGEPENDGNGQMCPVPGGGSSGGSTSGGGRRPQPTTRHRGGSGGGDTKAKLFP